MTEKPMSAPKANLSLQRTSPNTDSVEEYTGASEGTPRFLQGSVLRWNNGGQDEIKTSEP